MTPALWHIVDIASKRVSSVPSSRRLKQPANATSILGVEQDAWYVSIFTNSHLGIDLQIFAPLVVYDTLTGKIEQSIEGHKDIVRDVAWHPHRPEVLTSSWDSTVNINKFVDRAQASVRNERSKRLPRKRGPKKDDSEDRDGRPKLYSLRRSRRIANQRANNHIR